MFWAKIMQHQVRLMQHDGTAASLREWWGLARFLGSRERGLGDMLGMWFDYFHPGFHPWQHDNSELVNQWVRRFDRTLDDCDNAA